MKNVNALLKKTKKILEKFVPSRQDLLFGKKMEALSKWLNNDPEFMKEFNVELSLFPKASCIYRWTIRKYVLDVLTGAEDKKRLHLAQQSQSINFRCAAALRRTYPHSENFYIALPDYAALLNRTIVLGWEEEAEFLARLGFDDVDGVLDGGVGAIMPLPWFVLELVKDWLGARNVNLNTRWRAAYAEDLGPWQALLEGWRTPDPDAFGRLLDDLAERHVAHSKEAKLGARRDQHFDVEEPAYWVWPIELLAVLRLREWEGLDTPETTHPLFAVSPLGRLGPPLLERHTDPLLDAAFARFSAEHPLMPVLAELPELREKQGSR